MKKAKTGTQTKWLAIENEKRKLEVDVFWKLRKKCDCGFAQRMIGDGCEICNPERAKELAKQA